MREIHDGDDGGARGDDLSLARGAHVHFAVNRCEDPGVAELDLRLLCESAGVGSLIACFIHGAGSDVGEQFVGASLTKRSFGCGHGVTRGVDGRLVGLQAGDGVVLCLLAHDLLLSQRHGAAGISLLVVVVGLGLRQRSLCSAELGLCVEGCATGFAAGLVLGFDGLADFELLALSGGERRPAARPEGLHFR